MFDSGQLNEELGDIAKAAFEQGYRAAIDTVLEILNAPVASVDELRAALNKSRELRESTRSDG